MLRAESLLGVELVGTTRVQLLLLLLRKKVGVTSDQYCAMRERQSFGRLTVKLEGQQNGYLSFSSGCANVKDVRY